MRSQRPHTSRHGRITAGHGFTLVEMLIVVAVIGLLASIVVPTVGAALEYARRMSCANNLKGIATAMDMYLMDNDGIYPCAEDPVSTDPYVWLWMGRGWREPVAPFLGGSVKGHGTSALFCPSDQAGDKYEATSYAYSMSFYHSPAQIDLMTSKADTYSNPVPSVPQRQDNVVNRSGKIIVGEWTSNHDPITDDKGWWCWEGQRNYLYADGSVRYVAASEIAPARDGLPDPNLTVGGITGSDDAR